MPKKKVAVKGAIVRLRAYPIIEKAIEDGVSYGVQRFMKHRDRFDLGSENTSGLVEEITQHVQDALSEILIYDETIE
jgi:hypothetical protein